MSLRRLTHDSYRVGWICPLEVELLAAMEMLDEEHMALEQPHTDHNVYMLGSINGHNVVIAGLPQTGNCPAATVVTQMRMTFRNLRYGLLVGIGGGVPTETDEGLIRLGHVVVSKPTDEHSGAIQYDHGKARYGDFQRTGSLMPPPAVLLNAAQALAVQRDRMDYDPIWRDTLRFNTERRRLRRFKFPGIANDHLYLPDYDHQQQGVSCENGGCSPGQRIKRPFDEDGEEFVVVHRGTIASGEMVMRNATQRDRLAKRYRVLCFEMEAAGALADFPCMVIRGVSDYCDSHKNDSWVGFAAAAAAAYARQLFFYMPIELVQEPPDSQCKPTTFNLPFYLPDINRVSKFIAREAELTRMQEALQGAIQQRRAIVLHGLGGIGKTQLAIEYAHRHHKNFSTRVWLDARDETAINQSFARLAERIHGYDPSVDYISAAVQSQDKNRIVEAVKRWFDEPANNSWLIIYDNYDNPDLNIVGIKDKGFSPLPKDDDASRTNLVSSGREATAQPFDVRRYMPETDHGAIIITSRVSLSKLGSCIQVGKFQRLEESLEILASTSRRENIKQDSAAADLVRRLDGLPLAIASAGAYLEQVSMTCIGYLQLYEKSWVQLHETTPELPSYDKALCTTWNISYTHIEEQNSNAALLLRQWAYFDHNDLWYELLRDGRYKPNWLRESTRDSLTFNSIMRLLCNHGLVQANLPNPPDTMQRPESSGYSVHSCVHSWMIHVLNRRLCEEMARAALHCVASYIPGQEQPQFSSKQRRLLRHADRCLDLIKTVRIKNEDTELVYNLGSLYDYQGRLCEAEAMYGRALQGYKEAWGREHKSTLDTVNNMGVIYGLQGRFKEAEAMFDWALQGREKVLGPEHKLTLDTVNSLGIIYTDQARYEEAEGMYKRALQGRENEDYDLGPEPTSTLKVINNLGIIYERQGRFKEAEAMYERALRGREKVLGPEHPWTLKTVNNLGILYKSQGRFKDAEGMYERAVKGFEKAWGPEHISTLGAVTNLGNLYYYNQDRYDEAKALYEWVLEGYEKTLGFKAMKTYVPAVYCLQSFANVCHKQGELQKARQYYLRAREGYCAIFGADSEDVESVSRILEGIKL